MSEITHEHDLRERTRRQSERQHTVSVDSSDTDFSYDSEYLAGSAYIGAPYAIHQSAKQGKILSQAERDKLIDKHNSIIKKTAAALREKWYASRAVKKPGYIDRKNAKKKNTVQYKQNAAQLKEAFRNKVAAEGEDTLNEKVNHIDNILMQQDDDTVAQLMEQHKDYFHDEHEIDAVEDYTTNHIHIRGKYVKKETGIYTEMNSTLASGDYQKGRQISSVVYKDIKRLQRIIGCAETETVIILHVLHLLSDLNKYK